MGLATGRASLRQTNQPSGNPRLAQSPRLELLRVDPRALEGWAHRTSPTERSHRGGSTGGDGMIAFNLSRQFLLITLLLGVLASPVAGASV